MSLRSALVLALVPLSAIAGEPMEISPIVQLQLWGTAYDQDESLQADPAGYGDPEHDTGFSLRRARIGFEGHKGNLDFQLDLGYSSPYDSVIASQQGNAERFGLVNAFARGSWLIGPGTGRVSFGLVRVPFSRERIMASRELTFQDRSVSTTWMAPDQTLGVLFDYELPVGLRAQAGVYNSGGGLSGDSFNGMMAAGRIEYARGDTYRTYGEADGVDLGIGSSAFYRDAMATRTFGAEVDALVRVWRFSLFGEALFNSIWPARSTVNLPDALDPTERLGITAQLSYWQPLEKEGKPAVFRRAIEFSGQFSSFDDNRALSNNGDVAIVHGGFTLRNLVEGVDVGAGYIHRAELGGRVIPNDTVRVWGQLRVPVRGVRTTAVAPDLERILDATVPSEPDVVAPAPRVVELEEPPSNDDPQPSEPSEPGDDQDADQEDDSELPGAEE
jgi:hypothetical protein